MAADPKERCLERKRLSLNYNSFVNSLELLPMTLLLEHDRLVRLNERVLHDGRSDGSELENEHAFRNSWNSQQSIGNEINAKRKELGDVQNPVRKVCGGEKRIRRDEMWQQTLAHQPSLDFACSIVRYRAIGRRTARGCADQAIGRGPLSKALQNEQGAWDMENWLTLILGCADRESVLESSFPNLSEIQLVGDRIEYDSSTKLFFDGESDADGYHRNSEIRELKIQWTF